MIAVLALHVLAGTYPVTTTLTLNKAGVTLKGYKSARRALSGGRPVRAVPIGNEGPGEQSPGATFRSAPGPSEPSWRIRIAKTGEKAAALDAARPTLEKHLAGKARKKAIYVTGRILNVII